MARTKKAKRGSKTTTDGQMTRLPLALKPSNITMSISNSTPINQMSSNTTLGGGISSTSPSTNQTSPNKTARGSTSSTSSTTNQISSSTCTSSSSKTIPSSSDKVKSTLISKKTKAKSKAKIIDCTINSNYDNESDDDDARYDLKTSIGESGGIMQFLNTPCIILYKKQLKNQGDVEKYVLEHLSSYKENQCEFPGIKGTNELKEKINEFYRRYREKSMNSTILFKGNRSKTTATQQILLQNGSLYLYIDGVMKNKTSKNKKLKVPVDAAPAAGDRDRDGEGDDEHESEPSIVEDEGEISEEETGDINVSTGGAKQRSINWKGGSKNCGQYLLYNKEEEVKECVNNILSYGRDHGTLLSGVQLKTLFDIQNVEITKDRANTLVQLVTSIVDVINNPYFVPPTSKRPVYEYYGPKYQLAAVRCSKTIPIPNEILTQYQKEIDKKKEVDHRDKSWNEHEALNKTIKEKNSQTFSDEDVHEMVEVANEELIEEYGTNSTSMEKDETEEFNINYSAVCSCYLAKW